MSRLTKMYQRGIYRRRPPYAPYQGQIRVLHIIANNDGLSQKELAALLDVRSASMSELLDKLERSNLIYREKDELDKRITHVLLSPDGRELVNSSQNQTDFAEVLFGGLSTEEKYSFYSVVKKLCAVFEAQEILEEDDSDEPLPPHLREEHVPPPPIPLENRPLPPHLRRGFPPEGRPLPPDLQKELKPSLE